MPTETVNNGELFYFSDVDGLYHRLGEVQEFIFKEDDKLFENRSDEATLRNLAKDGYFEAEIDFQEGSKLVKDILSKIDEIFKRHVELSDLMWICEFAKRYIKEHYGEENLNETNIKN